MMGESDARLAGLEPARARPTLPLVLDGWVAARANVNIALIKYWGKAPAFSLDERNLPAVPSLSLTLSGLYTDTAARFAPELDADRVRLGGVELAGEELKRARHLLDAARRWFDVVSPFEVVSENTVPTAAGLASSASGMAALAMAVGRLVGLDPALAEARRTVSELARIGSGSACRSVFGGWVAWDGRAGRPLHPPDAEGLDVAVVVAVVSRERKAVSSRDGMTLTQETSPFFAGWVESSHARFHEAVEALDRRDLPALFAAMELSTWRMHASAMGANPPVCYWQPASLAALVEVDAMKRDGLVCGATLDAGPNVKIFCRRGDADTIARRLTTIPGVAHTIQALPGGGALCVPATVEPPVNLSSDIAPHGPNPTAPTWAAALAALRRVAGEAS